MLKLIKLEWKKNNIGKYIRNAIIIAALLCLFVFALAFLGIANDPDGTLDAAPGTNTISSPIELFTSMTFLIFTSVMLKILQHNFPLEKLAKLLFIFRKTQCYHWILTMVLAIWKLKLSTFLILLWKMILVMCLCQIWL